MFSSTAYLLKLGKRLHLKEERTVAEGRSKISAREPVEDYSSGI